MNQKILEPISTVNHDYLLKNITVMYWSYSSRSSATASKSQSTNQHDNMHLQQWGTQKDKSKRIVLGGTSTGVTNYVSLKSFTDIRESVATKSYLCTTFCFSILSKCQFSLNFGQWIVIWTIWYFAELSCKVSMSVFAW